MVVLRTTKQQRRQGTTPLCYRLPLKFLGLAFAVVITICAIFRSSILQFLNNTQQQILYVQLHEEKQPKIETRICNSSAFPTPEVPLFIKWEDFMPNTHNLYFIEIGGNVGKNTGSGDPVWEYVRPCNWSGAVLEPHPATYTILQNNYRDLEVHDRIKTLNLGASNGSGYTMMLGGGEMAYLSGEIVEHRGEVEEGTVVVEVVTLTQVWDKLKSHIPSTGVDILVIDVEGNERAVLADHKLPHPKPTRILFEIAHLSQEEKDIIDNKLRAEGYIQTADLIHRDDYAIRYKLPPQDRLYSLIN